jgi:3-hydroxyisobutyrate dehydrogenase
MFSQLVGGHTLINMATVSPGYSVALAKEVAAAGGQYVEAPVSGSRKPAEAGELIGMLAGDTSALPRVADLLKPMCRETVVCGSIPSALWMKLAVNLYMIIMITGLAEAVNLAGHRGLDIPAMARILQLGPMSSSLLKTKLQKLIAGDQTPQATIHNVLDNVHLISAMTRDTGVSAPLLDVCHELYSETNAGALCSADMIAVLHTFNSRSMALT